MTQSRGRVRIKAERPSAHLAGPEGALHVHPGIADGGHADEQQRAERAVGDALGGARDLALRYQVRRRVRVLLLVAQHTPARHLMVSASIADLTQVQVGALLVRKL